MLIKAQTVLVIPRLVCLNDLTCNYSLISKHPIVIISVLICFNYVNALTDDVLYRPISIQLRHVLQPNEASVCARRQPLNWLIFAHTLSVVRRFQSEVCRPN